MGEGEENREGEGKGKKNGRKKGGPVHPRRGFAVGWWWLKGRGERGCVCLITNRGNCCVEYGPNVCVYVFDNSECLITNLEWVAPERSIAPLRDCVIPETKNSRTKHEKKPKTSPKKVSLRTGARIYEGCLRAAQQNQETWWQTSADYRKDINIPNRGRGVLHKLLHACRERLRGASARVIGFVFPLMIKQETSGEQAGTLWYGMSGCVPRFAVRVVCMCF